MKIAIRHLVHLSMIFVLALMVGGCAHTQPQQPTTTLADICEKPFSFEKLKTSKQYDLVFEGGGAKGTAFVGALQELEAQGISGRRFVGTSAGAITATLLAAGYTSAEMRSAVNEKMPDKKPRFSTFMDIVETFTPEDIQSSYTYDFFRSVDLPFVSDRVEKKIDAKIFAKLMKHERYRVMFSFVERGGVYEGQKFLVWMTEKLNAKCRNLGDATFEQFYQQTGNELTVVATDTSGHQKLVLNRLTAPKCPVAWAVRMSMSIPFFWQEVRWLSKWGTYRGEDISGHIIVDGGVLSNFPLDLVVGNDNEIKEIMGLSGVGDGQQLGFLIDESCAVPGADGTKPKVEKTIFDDAKELKTIKRVLRLIDTMTDANDNGVIRAYKDKVCRLPAKGYGTTEFDMSDERVELLIKAGREAANDCLTR